MIAEPQVDRLLADLRTTLDELLAPAGQLESRLARAQVPPEAADAMAHLLASIVRDVEVMRAKGAEIAPQLARALETMGRKMAWLAGRTEEKFLAHVRRRDAETNARIRRARESLRPAGRPQERVFTVAPFLARYGPGLLTELAATIRTWYASALEGGGTTP